MHKRSNHAVPATDGGSSVDLEQHRTRARYLVVLSAQMTRSGQAGSSVSLNGWTQGEEGIL